MHTGKVILDGMMRAFRQMGIMVDKIDTEKQILYLTIPKDSFIYHKDDGTVTSAEGVARRIKESWIKLGIFPECKVRFKEMDIFWTDEMRKESVQLSEKDE